MNDRDDIKIGLALSGGGFRSALFHIGVMAHLAELDLLRKIDVISSVSAGSIIAAYFYLKVKALLEKPLAGGQDAPGKEAYIRLVSEIETDFLAAVQKNMLMRTFLDPVKNSRMLGTEYSSTERLAELFTKYFYQPVLQTSHPDGFFNQIQLKNISVKPLGENLLPDTRIPHLIINATCMNTGHLWQFTDTSAGEQPTPDEPGNDPIPFLTKFRFDDERLTIEQRKILYNITLGQAVAASCCVPGIFEPLQIRNLYRSEGNPLKIRLVDGGLVDNQGLISLCAEKCSHIICSDASDILQLHPNPSGQFLDAAMRANDILIDRIRGKSLQNLSDYAPGRFVVLDLGNLETRNQVFPAESQQIVRALTRIRTDLDAFTDREADTLMFYGYQLCRIRMNRNHLGLPLKSEPENPSWRFLEIQDQFLNHDDRRKDLLFHLEVGSRQMFKIFLLKKVMPYVILLPIPILCIIAAFYLIAKTSPAFFWGFLLICMIILIYTQNQRILKLIESLSFVRKIKQQFLKILIFLRLPEPFSYLLAFISWIQLIVFDRLFLHYGRIHDTFSKTRMKKNQP